MIRHAKSSWANPLQSDFERPLNDRGEKDAPLMGKRLKKAGITPDLVIASTAKRTRQTAEIIAKATGYPKDNIRWEEKLYHCVPAVYEDLMYEIGPEIKTLFIVGHNPGITEFVNQMSRDFYTGNMPTCGVAGAEFEADDWGMFAESQRALFLFDYPKNEDGQS